MDIKKYKLKSMKRNDNIILKLSNVLNNLHEFYNRCTSELIMTTEVEEQLEELWENYLNICSNTVDGLFHTKEQRELSIQIIEFCMDNFSYFKNIFDYTLEETEVICPGNMVANYSAIYDKLIDIYEIPEFEPDTIGVGGYETGMEELEADLETYNFLPNEIFELKPEWIDGPDKTKSEYFVIEDRDDKVLASPNWETGMSIIPQEVIRKSMILEVKPYMRKEKIKQKLTKKKKQPKPINLLEKYSDEQKSEFVSDFLNFKEKITGFTTINDKYNLSVGDIILFKNGFDIEMITEVLGFDSDGDCYLLWDCYWSPIRLNERFISKQ